MSSGQTVPLLFVASFFVRFLSVVVSYISIADGVGTMFGSSAQSSGAVKRLLDDQIWEVFLGDSLEQSFVLRPVTLLR